MEVSYQTKLELDQKRAAFGAVRNWRRNNSGKERYSLLKTLPKSKYSTQVREKFRENVREVIELGPWAGKNFCNSYTQNKTHCKISTSPHFKTCFLFSYCKIPRNYD